ncbi:MAG: hypothetical protein MJA83_14215 [Gammaproteobacteria bacterium]|nr:hypothetical protein [Gammaproteobacteria bacterium]
MSVFAALVWASWAYYVNVEFGRAIGMKAAITQGVFSFVMTFFFTSSVELLYSLSHKRSHQYLLAFVTPVSVLGVLLWLTHYFRATPNIAVTIAPSLVLAGVFCISYILAQSKLRRVSE